MKETKNYILGYNRYQGKVVTYNSEEQAKDSGGYWRVIEADDYKSAKDKFIEIYHENHIESE